MAKKEPPTSSTRRIEYRPLDDIRENPANPKGHDVDTINGSVARFGYIDGVAIDERTGYLISGHGRTKTLRAMHARGDAPPDGIQVGEDGAWLVPVQVGWASRDDTEAAGALIALNRTTELGGWVDESLLGLLDDLSDGGNDTAGLLGVGFNGDELEELRGKLNALDEEPIPGSGAGGDGGGPSFVPKDLAGVRDLVTLHHGDCIDVLKTLPDASVDAVVTDPPYGLEFMGKEWDAHETGKPFQDWCGLWAAECLRVLKPGGHMLAFGGSRTWHRLAAAVEDAGFEIRDSIAWLYGSGFPKSLSVAKATHNSVESRYGNARCDCLDAGDGRPDRDDLGREDRAATGTVRASGQVPAQEARNTDLPLVKGGDHGPLRELREDDAAEAARQAPLRSTVLLPGVRGSGSEAARHGDPAVRARMEEPTHRGAEAGQDVSRVREDAGGERERLACASPAAVPVRRDEPAGEPGGAVRLVPPHDRGSDGSGTGIDPGRRDPRRVHSDGDGRGRGPVARVCSWCGLPDRDWLTSLEPLGTALKPAFEPIVVGRKPLDGTVAANVLAYGTGALNIDGCRVGLDGERPPSGSGRSVLRTSMEGGAMHGTGAPIETNPAGRWPVNVVLDESQAEELDRQSGFSQSPPVGSVARTRGEQTIGTFSHEGRPPSPNGYGDSGGASRFFPTFRYEAKAPTSERPREDDVAHPTVKPVDLMRWLVRLVTPPGGVVLEPFAGSGTTLEAAVLEGFACIGIEREASYLPLIRQRLGLSGDAEL